MCLTNIIRPQGWNDYVKDAHSEARDAFKLWVRSSKPRPGAVIFFPTLVPGSFGQRPFSTN